MKWSLDMKVSVDFMSRNKKLRMILRICTSNIKTPPRDKATQNKLLGARAPPSHWSKQLLQWEPRVVSNGDETVLISCQELRNYVCFFRLYVLKSSMKYVKELTWWKQLLCNNIMGSPNGCERTVVSSEAMETGENGH